MSTPVYRIWPEKSLSFEFGRFIITIERNEIPRWYETTIRDTKTNTIVERTGHCLSDIAYTAFIDYQSKYCESVSLYLISDLI